MMSKKRGRGFIQFEFGIKENTETLDKGKVGSENTPIYGCPQTKFESTSSDMLHNNDN